MLRVDHEKWGQSVQTLRDAAMHSAHPRTRERFFALYEISQGRNATRLAAQTGRNHQTIQGWVKSYNSDGPEVIGYRHTGGRPPFLTPSPNGHSKRI